MRFEINERLGYVAVGVIVLAALILFYIGFTRPAPQAQIPVQAAAPEKKAPKSNSPTPPPTPLSLIDPADEDPIHPQYAVGGLYPVCGITKEIQTYDVQGKPAALKLPLCSQLTGNVDGSNAPLANVISVGPDHIEVEFDAPEEKYDTFHFRGVKGSYFIKNEDFTTAVMLDKGGKKYPRPFLRASIVNKQAIGTLEWCDPPNPEGQAFVAEGATLFFAIQPNYAVDCKDL